MHALAKQKILMVIFYFISGGFDGVCTDGKQGTFVLSLAYLLSKFGTMCLHHFFVEVRGETQTDMSIYKH